VHRIHGSTTRPEQAQPKMPPPLASDEEAHQIWERVMGTSPLPRGYKKTSVLFLGWAEEEDDTEGYDEVRFH
jgi:hypothetical protein